MIKTKALLLFISFGYSINVSAQSPPYIPYMLFFPEKEPMKISYQGDFTLFTTTKTVNLMYDYSNLTVIGISEKEYLEKRTKKLSTKRGDKFKELWFSSRLRYESKFETLFNKYGSDLNVSGINYTNDKLVTAVVNIEKMLPNEGKGAKISFRVAFMDKQNVELFSYNLEYVKGRDYMECYALAARILMKDITKTLKVLE